jgi:hypothetical protein
MSPFGPMDNVKVWVWLAIGAVVIVIILVGLYAQ